MAGSENRVGRKSAGGWEAKAAAALLITGAGLVFLSLLLPHPSGGDETALLATATGMALVGVVAMAFSGRIPDRKSTRLNSSH